MTQAPAHAYALPPAARRVITRPAGGVHHAIGLLALDALRDELLCYPKPGLVSLVDNGSHGDMHAGLFLRSMHALRGYFPAITAAGAEDAPFARLQTLGRTAEGDMLRATGGVNTHRGAIFCLGLLAAAAGRRLARGEGLTGRALGTTVRNRWGEAILASARATGRGPTSHGARVAQRYGQGGARAEAAAGFPHVFNVGLPALRHALQQTADYDRARVQCFFSLMAVVPDTNLLYRGGTEGLAFARHAARGFLAADGVHHPAWRSRARTVHAQFMRRRLSPGGSADLLAATLLVHHLAQGSGE
jgi:triphosphoribosyl-dephospho-CoA synthase